MAVNFFLCTIKNLILLGKDSNSKSVNSKEDNLPKR